MQGATIEVEVLSQDKTVEVSTGGPPTSYPVGPDGKVSIPTPPGFTGFVSVSVGHDLNRQVILVEIVAPSP
ncbi:MAG TPA: hypothetical protein ENI87_07695 [bacterium]|nr:hypothetical protein [bacterium]